MKNLTLLLILIALIAGCGSVTSYVVKNDRAFDKSEFQASEAIGIAVYHNMIIGLIESIKKDCNRFAEKSFDFHDLSDELILSASRNAIENAEEIIKKYPDIKYVFAVFEGVPKIEKYKFTNSVETTIPKKEANEYQCFRTTLNLEIEISLFDLSKNTLIAMSVRNLYEEATEAHQIDRDSISYFLDWLFSKPDHYPHVPHLAPDHVRNYFYYFLKHINYEGNFDNDYIYETGRPWTPSVCDR